MMKKQPKEWFDYLAGALDQLINGEALAFNMMTPSKIPKRGGVYLISAKGEELEIPYYVGRSKNLRNRIYKNHLMGQLSNARLKKYLVMFNECRNPKEAKEFIRERCIVRWFFENDTRKRGAVEGYVTGVVFPKYGIYEEH
jgi:hypothetical protein